MDRGITNDQVVRAYLPLVLLVVAQLILFQPSLSWYVARITDGSDEPLGILAIAAIGILAALQHQRLDRGAGNIRGSIINRGSLCLPTVILITCVVCGPFLPPLGRAACAALSIATTLGAVVFRKPLHAGLCILALLSLPLISTLQFYAGFPLRYATGQIVAAAYRLIWLPVYADGTLLRYGDATVWIDAPCSGIKALWCSLYFAAVLITLKPLSFRHTSLLWSATSAGVFLGNCGRNAALFLVEISKMPEEIKSAIHPVVGLILLGGIIGLISLIWRRLPEKQFLSASRVGRLPLLCSKEPVADGVHRCRTASAVQWACGVSVAIGISLIVRGRDMAWLSIDSSRKITPSFFQEGVAREITQEEQALFDSLLTKRDLSELPLSSRERRWMAEFPGSIRRLTSHSFPPQHAASDEVPNHYELLLRTVRVPTRKLHPIGDCLRGAGYRVTPLPAHRGKDGILKGCVLAEKVKTKNQKAALRVCEYLVDKEGASFPDVSTWYWAATFSQTVGPWMSVVEIMEDS